MTWLFMFTSTADGKMGIRDDALQSRHMGSMHIFMVLMR